MTAIAQKMQVSMEKKKKEKEVKFLQAAEAALASTVLILCSSVLKCRG